ncbi:MAG: leucine--tRNA ligase [Planctomycetales bacterium]|nr:leucine--tRNA ligase [Planctomycetales bacterium]NIM07993.1 leucine--tRNA ligase [Planctomycetales bacterium]NIN07471.1 leucine--tRNA ligase [Planctomycetales bacterium]NIN76578.1 leucine--tRNA ligase [Planctomycetales bacterium]NIO33765.1 leucine--tRNA ligase [Planctomycetales bacterium]
MIEPRWQKTWEAQGTFASPRLPQGEKLYALDMFPYPSGDGLHVGHPEGYTATDIVARYARMCGKSVLHPMGFDAFGLPAEEHAIRTNTPPRVQTEKNIENFRRQLKMLGFSYDWDREISTTDVAYFRWTQWIFLQMYDSWFDHDQQRGRPIAELPIPDEVQQEGDDAVRRYQDDHRLAYQSDAPVNWCPALGTVLANEEVVDGKSERGGHPVVRKPLRQWMLRITAYAQRLESDLEGLDWPESIKALQRNWIGRSTGAEVDFYIGAGETYDPWCQARRSTGFPRQPDEDCLRVYTTRPDTLFGATYMVIAPEHPAVESLTTAAQAAAVNAYCEQAAQKSDLDRTDLAKEKTGVFTGSSAINPVNGESIPIWIADYVLISYGTGAIMAVPAHDQRDFEFAQQFEIPILAVVDPGGDTPEATRADILAATAVFTAEGTAVHSGVYDGLSTAEFKSRITDDLAAQGLGRAAVNYKLRDWLFSRQRFWGEPFPVLHELDAEGQPTGRVRTVPEDQLPVDLPELADFKPHGRPEPPLDKAADEWLYPVLDGVRYKRETNTMPQWAGSCWYYLRFLDPHNASCLVDPQVEAAWMPVDLYIGGAEHAVLHLLYARFWHKLLYDRGVVSTPEPFRKLVNQGMILGEDGEKMSKSRGNVINPDKIVTEYGADTLRLYEMFMGPLTKSPKAWSTQGVNGVRGFLDRVWRMIVEEDAEQPVVCGAVQDVAPTEPQNRVLHKTIRAVTHDLETLSFNTAIARMMEFTNFFLKEDVRPKSAMQQLVLLLSPLAPHLCEELWQVLGHSGTLAYHPWPKYDESLIAEDTVEIPVQIQGRLRGKIAVPSDADRDAMETAARTDPKIAQLLADQTVVKVVVVPGRLVNFVMKGS